MGYTHGIIWNKENIKNEIYKIMNVLEIERMPSASEIGKVTGNTRLVNAIRRHGGYYNTAITLGLDIKDSETKTGTKGEFFIKGLLERRGYSVEKMSTRHSYDLLVDSNVRIDVKTAKKYKSPKGFSFHTFNLEKKNPTCDIYILLKLEEKKVYIVPSKFTHQTQISMGNKSKYDEYENRFDYIDLYSKFYESVM